MIRTRHLGFGRTRSHCSCKRSRRLDDAFAAHGVQLVADVEYADVQSAVANNRDLTSLVTVLGLLIVAISMIGLLNTMTLAVIERTPEIGIMRCLGGRSRDVRRIFATEALAVVLAGWLIGVPLGFALAHGVVELADHAIEVQLLFTFPLHNIPIALAGALVLAALATAIPLQRAVIVRPGEALRYA